MTPCVTTNIRAALHALQDVSKLMAVSGNLQFAQRQLSVQLQGHTCELKQKKMSKTATTAAVTAVCPCGTANTMCCASGTGWRASQTRESAAAAAAAATATVSATRFLAMYRAWVVPLLVSANTTEFDEWLRRQSLVAWPSSAQCLLLLRSQRIAQHRASNRGDNRVLKATKRERHDQVHS